MDSSVSDSDDELVALPTPLQRVDARSFMKRTYAFDHSCLEPKLEHQLDWLRALVPHHSSRQRKDRKEFVVLDAYYYIATLQKQVDDLSSELLEDDSLAQTREARETGVLPLVEVMKRDGVLEVRVVCSNRPGLLVDVMEAVESKGLIVTHAKITCQCNTVFQSLSLESEEEGDEEEEIHNVKAMLVNAISGSDLE